MSVMITTIGKTLLTKANETTENTRAEDDLTSMVVENDAFLASPALLSLTTRGLAVCSRAPALEGKESSSRGDGSADGTSVSL
jgi:hypothetical protein